MNLTRMHLQSLPLHLAHWWVVLPPNSWWLSSPLYYACYISSIFLCWTNFCQNRPKISTCWLARRGVPVKESWLFYDLKHLPFFHHFHQTRLLFRSRRPKANWRFLMQSSFFEATDDVYWFSVLICRPPSDISSRTHHYLESQKIDFFGNKLATKNTKKFS